MPYRERDDFVQLLEALVVPKSHNESLKAVLMIALRITGSTCGHLVDFSSTFTKGGLTDVSAAIPELMSTEEYEEAGKVFYASSAGWKTEQMYSGPKRVFRSAEGIDPEVFRSSRFYKEFVVPFGFTDSCGCLFRDGTEPFRYGAAMSTRAPGGYTEEQLDALDRMVSVLERVLRQLDEVRAKADGCTVLEYLAKETHQPLLAVQSGKSSTALLATSKSAKQILGTKSAALDSLLPLIGRAAKQSKPARWTAPDSSVYSVLISAAPPGSSQTSLLVRLIPAKQETNALRESALTRGLSERETEITLLMAQGKSDKEIARALHISYHTARAHLRSIYSKLKVRGRMEARNLLERF